MKQLISMTLLAGVLLMPACAGTAFKKSLLATGEAVNAAMNAYGTLYRAGVLTDDQIEDVRTGHANFQLAYNRAVQLAETDYSKLTPIEISNLAFDLILTINELRGKHPEIEIP